MKKILALILFSIFFFALFFSLSAEVVQASASDSCKEFSTTPDYKTWTTATKVQDITNITIGPGTGITGGTPLFPLIKTDANSFYYLSPDEKGVGAEGGKINFKPRDPGGSNSRLTSEGSQTILLSKSQSDKDDQIICSSTYTVRPFQQLRCTLIVENYLKSFGPEDPIINIKGIFYYVDVHGNEPRYANQDVDVRLFSNYQKNTQGQADLKTDDLGLFTGTRNIPPIIDPGDIGKWYITASPTGLNNFNEQTCTQAIYVSQESGKPLPEGMSLSGNQPGLYTPGPDDPAPPPPCEEGKAKDGTTINTLKTPSRAGEIAKCTKVKTAVGSIGTDPAEFIKSIFSLLLGVAGGIAVVLIIISGYKLMASQGNPEKVQGAREMLTSAIVGLLFIIFSFVILQIIGVDILRIPGFSK